MTDKIKPDSATEQKIVDMLDALQQGAVQVGGEAVKYAPDVADAALWVIRIDGAQTLVRALLIVIISGVVLYKAAKYTMKHWQEWFDDVSPALVFAPLAVAGAGGFWAYWLLALTDIWNWVAVFEPKLWLAKQIMQSTIGG